MNRGDSKFPPFLPERYAELIANPGPAASANGLSHGMRIGWALAVARRKAEVEAAAFPARSAAAKRRSTREVKNVKA